MLSIHNHFMQLFSADTTIFKENLKLFFAPENMKKPTSKVAHNRPNFFSVLPTPKSQFLFHTKLLTKQLMYNHFA